MKPQFRLRSLALLLLAAACGDSDGLTPPPSVVVTSIEVTPPATQLGVGDTLQLLAVVKDQHGAAISGRALTWSSGDVTVASVSAGFVTAVGAGSAEITASVEGKSGSATVSVRPPVASVVIGRDTATLEIGATLQLSATARDAQGTVLASRAITWTSMSAGSSVSTTGLVTALQAGQSLILATSEGKSDTTIVSVKPGILAVTKEAGTSVKATLGSAGGTIQTTDRDGAHYTLVVPPLALKNPVEIAMTPLANVTGLPLSGGFVVGADFQPSGLVFAVPATLTITSSAQPPAGQQLVGFSATSGGDSVTLAPAQRGPSSITMPVKHFSITGTGFGTTQNMQALYLGTNFPLTGSLYVQSLVILSGYNPRDIATEQEIYHKWFDTWVLPNLQAVTTDAGLLQAIADYDDWETGTPNILNLFAVLPGGFDSPELTSRRALWAQEFATKVKQAIAGNNQLCAGPGTITSARMAALNNAIFWHTFADIIFGVATAQNGLDVASFRAGLCAKVVTQNLSLPDPIEESVQTTLDATFALNFGNGTAVVPENFDVQTSSTGVTLENWPTGTAQTPKGFFTGILRGDPGAGTAIISMQVCYSAFLGASNPTIASALSRWNVCHTEHIVRNVGEVRIDALAFPNGVVGTSYSKTLSATGGSASYQWSIVGGSLPPGLALNASTGSVSGTPTSAGSFAFTTRVMSGLLTDDASFTIIIAPSSSPPPPPPGSCGGTITNPGQITTQAQLTSIMNAEDINGNLQIIFSSIPQITLPCLKRVTGVVQVNSNIGLVSIAFPALEEVGNFVNVTGNLVLTTARFPVLRLIGATASLSGSLGVYSNAVLATLEVGPVDIRRVSNSQGGGMQLLQPLPALTSLGLLSSGIAADTLFFSLPGTGQNGFTDSVVRAFGSRAQFTAVCELLPVQGIVSIPGSPRKCQ